MKRKLSLLLALVLCLTLCAPLAHAAPAEGPTLISEGAVLMDAQTGQVLFEKNMNEKKFPASITKIMTTFLAIEKGPMDAKLTVSREAVESVSRDSSHISLAPDEEITLEEAVCAALLVSANDACNVIAEYVSGSVAEFTNLMNERARECGAVNTHFNNANGLRDENHYTTPYDMAMITRQAIANETFRNYFGLKQFTMKANNQQPEERVFNNQHSMLTDASLKYEGIIGGKAGYTTDALYTLVTVAERNGRTLIAVVMKSPKLNDKYTDTKALLDYGFDNFETVQFTPEELARQDVPAVTADGEETTVSLSMNEPVTLALLKGIEKDAIQVSVEIPEPLTAETTPTVSFSLPEGQTGMYAQLGSYPYSEAKLATAAEADAGASEGGGFWSGVLSVLKVIGIILLILIGLVVLLVLVLWIRKLHYRRKKRQRRRAQREAYYRRQRK